MVPPPPPAKRLTAAAAALVGARADADLAEHRTVIAARCAGDLEPPVRRYLDALVDGVEGAIRHHRRADPARYRASDPDDRG